MEIRKKKHRFDPIMTMGSQKMDSSSFLSLSVGIWTNRQWSTLVANPSVAQTGLSKEKTSKAKLRLIRLIGNSINLPPLLVMLIDGE